MTTTHPMIERLTEVVRSGRALDVGCTDIVIAVLRALREPDEGMNTAGSRIGDYPWDGRKPSRIFAAMIDSILTEQKEQP